MSLFNLLFHASFAAVVAFQFGLRLSVVLWFALSELQVYIYDRKSENEDVYLPRPRQCLPIAYVIYNRRMSIFLPVIPVYHFHCSGSQQSSEMIDLTRDDENTNGAASSTAENNVSLESLERHFKLLTQDMLPTQSQQDLSSAVSSAASLTSLAVIGTSGAPATFMFPVRFSSAATPTAERPRMAATRTAFRQPVRAGTVRDIVAGRVSISTPQVSSESVRSTAVPGWRTNTYLSQYLNSLSAHSVTSTLAPRPTVSLTSQSIVGPVSQTVSHTSSSSVSSQLHFIPLSVVASCGPSLHLVSLNSLSNTLSYLPYSVSNVQVSHPSSADAYRGTVYGVQRQRGTTPHYTQQPQCTQNYSAFRLQRQLPQQQSRTLVFPPQVVTTTVQQQFNIASVCTGYGANLTSVRFTQPAPLVTTIPSQYQRFAASVTSASSETTSALAQMQMSQPTRQSTPSVSSFALPHTQTSWPAGHSTPHLQHTSADVNVTWIAGTAGGQMVSSTECTTTSVLPSYASTLTDEFVDMESIDAGQFPPIVIAPDDCVDTCDRPADYAVADVCVKQEPVASLRKSSRRLREVICIDDDDGTSAVVPTDGTSSEFTTSDDQNSDYSSIDFDRLLPTLLSDSHSIPAINIVPDSSVCSPVEADDLQASVASTVITSENTAVSLHSSDTANVGPVTVSCVASSGVLSTVLPLRCGSLQVETDGISFARSVESTGIMLPSSAPNTALVHTLQNAIERNSVNTVHHFPQSDINFSPAFASVLANSSVGASSAPVFYSITAQPVIATPISLPVMLAVLPSVCSISTSVSSLQTPVSNAPFVSLAKQASNVIRTCDVTAVATQLVSGLRSDAMRRRATSAAKVAVHQSSESESNSARSQKRHAGKHATDSPAKISRHAPTILRRSRSQLQETTKEPANELASTSLPVTSGISNESVESNVTLNRWKLSGDYHSQLASSLSLDSPVEKVQKPGETVVYHLNEDGSIEIRIFKGSILETASRGRKQTLKQPASAAHSFDAIVELGSSASQSWHSESFVAEMGKHFSNLKVVKQPGNDCMTCDKWEAVSVGKQQVTDDADDVEPDSDSRDTLSLVISSVEPSDEEDEWQLAVDDEAEDSSGLKICNIENVCSLNAEAFTNLNERVFTTESSTVSDTPYEAVSTQGKETSQPSYIDMPVIVANVSENTDSTEVVRDKHHSNNMSNTAYVGNSSSSAECQLVPTGSDSSSGECCENDADLEEKLSPHDMSGDTSLFEISLDSDRDADSEATISVSVASSESTAEPFVDQVDTESNSQAVEQQASLPLGEEIPLSTQLSCSDDERDEAVEQPVDVNHQSSASEECTSSIPLQLLAECDDAECNYETDFSIVLDEDEVGDGQLITETSSSNSCDVEQQDYHVTRCRQQNEADTEKDAVTPTSSNIDPNNDENMQSQVYINDADGPLLPSHINATDGMHLSFDSFPEPYIRNVNQNSCPSSAASGGTGATSTEYPLSTSEDRLHQLDNLASGQQRTSAGVMPESNNSPSSVSCVNCSDVISTEPDSPPSPEPCTIVLDMSDEESDDSASLGRLEMKSTAKDSEAPASCGHHSLPDAEPVSPPPSEPHCDTDELVGHTMTVGPSADKLDHQTSDHVGTELVRPAPEVSSLPDHLVDRGQESASPPLLSNSNSAPSAECSYNSFVDRQLELELLCDRSAPETGPLVSVSKKLESKDVLSSDKRTDAEAVYPVLLVSMYDASTPFTEASHDIEAVTPLGEDSNAEVCDVEPDSGSTSVSVQSGQEVEKLSSETRSSDSNMIDMEPVSSIHSEQPCGIDVDLSDVVPSDPSHTLENEMTASATEDTVIDTEPTSPPEAPLASSHLHDLVSLPSVVTEKSVSPARYALSNTSDVRPVSQVEEPTRNVAANLCEPEHSQSSHNLNLASLPSPMTEESSSTAKHSSSEPLVVKSPSLSIFVKSLFDARPVSPEWLSETLSTPYASSELRHRGARSDVQSRREHAFLRHHLDSVSTYSAGKQPSELHRASSRTASSTTVPPKRTTSVAKVPKRITLADYRSRKNASQVDVSDKICQQVELSQVATSDKTSSKFNSTSAAEMPSKSRSPIYSSAIASNSEGAGLVDNPSQKRSDSNRSHNTNSSSNTAVSCNLQQTAVPPYDVSHTADLSGSSNSPAAMMSQSTDFDDQAEKETNTSSIVDDNGKATTVDKECMHEHQSETEILEADASDVLPAASCANIDDFHLVNQNNVEQRAPLSSSLVDDMAANLTNDRHKTKLSPENTEALCFDAEPSVNNDDHTEAVEMDSTVSQSLTGIYEEILDDLLLDIAEKGERKAKRKQLSVQCKAAKQPWNFTLIPIDLDNFSNCEPTIFCGSDDIRTLPKQCIVSSVDEIALRDSPVTIPTERLVTYSTCSGSVDANAENVVHSDTLCTATNSMAVASLGDAGASSSGTGKDGQLLYLCKEMPLLTDSSELISVVNDDTRTSEGHRCSSLAQVTDNLAKTALKPGPSVGIQVTSSTINKQVNGSAIEDVSVSVCTESAHTSDNGSILSPVSAIVVEMDTDSSKSEFKIAAGQHKADVNSSHATIAESGAVTVPDDSQVEIKTLTGLTNIPDSQIAQAAVNSEKPLESLAQNLPDSSEVPSKTDDYVRFSLRKRPKAGHLKAAAMWQNSMRNWVNMDVSKNKDVVVPKYTLSNDYFVMRQNAFQLMKSVLKLASRTRLSLKNTVCSSLKETENLLHEELVFADVDTLLDSTEAKLLTEKQHRMADLLCSVEAQLRNLSVELYGMPDAEAELSCYEKADWSTESGLHHNILLLTRHMLYKEMSKLRCYHNSRLVYRLPDELCLDVERDRFVSIEGSVLFLKYSILSLAECRQLFAMKVEIEEAQCSLARLDHDYRGSDKASRLGTLHQERRKKLDSIAVTSVDSLRTLQTFLAQQLHWYRYVNWFLIYC